MEQRTTPGFAESHSCYSGKTCLRSACWAIVGPTGAFDDEVSPLSPELSVGGWPPTVVQNVLSLFAACAMSVRTHWLYEQSHQSNQVGSVL